MGGKFKRVVATSLIFSLSGAVIPLPAQAAMLSTNIATEAVISSPQRERVTNFLARGDVQRQLERYGVKAGDVQARVAALSDAEVAQISNQIDALPAGGDAAGAIVGLALLVFVILVITDLLGVTHVFPFIKPMR